MVTPNSVAALRGLRNRLRPAFALAAAVSCLVAALWALSAPTGWPPLHARCLGAMLMSFSLALALARRAVDPAALRIPLLALASWSLASAGVAGLQAQHGWPWLLTAIGAAALLLARVDDDAPAPAQHADRAWAALALAALLSSLPLFVSAEAAARHWPWRIAPHFAAQYAPLFLACSVVAWQLARERRRYVRASAASGLLAWALGTLAASLWHAAAFRWANPLAWGWFTAFVVVALLAAQRLWPGWLRRRRAAWLGPRPHDSGTDWPRH